MWEFIHCVHMWFSGVCHLYTSLTGEVKSLLDTNFSNCFQNSVDFKTLKLHSPQPVIEVFLASSKQAPFSETKIFWFFFTLQAAKWCSLLVLRDWLPKLELTVFSLKNTAALVCWRFLFSFVLFFLTSQISFIITDENECSALPCANRTSFIYGVIKETLELWHTRLWRSQGTTVPLWWVPNAVVTQNLHDKDIKKIFSTGFQMTEAQVSIRGATTYAPVCKIASCHWEEQLFVCSFMAVSYTKGQTGHHRSCWSLHTGRLWLPTQLALSEVGLWEFLCLLVVPQTSGLSGPCDVCVNNLQQGQLGLWVVGPDRPLCWHKLGGCSAPRACWAQWHPQCTKSASPERLLPTAVQLVKGLV